MSERMDATEELIRRLAAEPARIDRAGRSLVLPAALAAAILLAFGPVLTLLGLRVDLASALSGLGGHKILAGAITALGAAMFWRESARPDGRTWPVILLFPGLSAFGTPMLLSGTALPTWSMLLSDPAGPVCFTTILVIGLLPLAALVAGLRQSAPSHPALAGFAAGTLAAGLASCAYAMHCTVDTVDIACIWYPAAVVTTSLSGALVGSRWLAW